MEYPTATVSRKRNHLLALESAPDATAPNYSTALATRNVGATPTKRARMVEMGPSLSEMPEEEEEGGGRPLPLATPIPQMENFMTQAPSILVNAFLSKETLSSPIPNLQETFPGIFPVVPSSNGQATILPVTFLSAPTIIGVQDNSDTTNPNTTLALSTQTSHGDRTLALSTGSASAVMEKVAAVVHLRTPDGKIFTPATILPQTLVAKLPQLTEQVHSQMEIALRALNTNMMDKVEALHSQTGLVMKPDALANSMTNLRAPVEHQYLTAINDSNSEDLRKAWVSITSERGKKDAANLHLLHESVERLAANRRKAMDMIAAGINLLMEAHKDAVAVQEEVSLSMYADFVGSMTQVEQLLEAAKDATHSTSISSTVDLDKFVTPIFLAAVGVPKEQASRCLLTTTRLLPGEGEDCPPLLKRDIYIPSHKKGLVLFRPTVEELVHQLLMGLPLRGKKPPTLPVDPLRNGLTLWEADRNATGIERLSVAAVTPRVVLPASDVCQVRGKERVSAWCTLFQALPLTFTAPHRGNIPTTSQLKELLDPCLFTIPQAVRPTREEVAHLLDNYSRLHTDPAEDVAPPPYTYTADLMQAAVDDGMCFPSSAPGTCSLSYSCWWGRYRELVVDELYGKWFVDRLLSFQPPQEGVHPVSNSEFFRGL